MKRLMKLASMFLALALVLSVSVPAFAAETNTADSNQVWKELYHNEIKEVLNNKNNNFNVSIAPTVLADIDLDGIPELFICSLGNAVSGVEYAYTVKNGNLILLNFDGLTVDGISPFTELYYNSTTGKMTVEHECYDHDGLYFGEYSLSEITLDNNQLNAKQVFKGQTESGTETPITTCYLYGKEVSETEYNAALAEWHTGWEKISNYKTFIATLGCVTKFENGYSDNDTVAFLNSYSSTPVKVSASSANIVIDGNKKNVALYGINGNNYIKLRDVASLLNGSSKSFSVDWSRVDNTISLQTGKPYVSVGNELAKVNNLDKIAEKTIPSMKLNGSPLQLTAYSIDNNNYFKLRDIAQAINFGVGWDNTTKTILIDTTTGYSK